jgi:hypothetical protein
MSKSIYRRAIGISLLKSISYIIGLAAGLLFIADRVPPLLFVVALYFFYVVITFLFGEWIFEDGSVGTKQLIMIILVTFLVEMVITISFFRYMGIAALTFENISKSVVFLVLHGGALFAALYVRKRMLAKEGLAEGLES